MDNAKLAHNFSRLSRTLMCVTDRRFLPAAIISAFDDYCVAELVLAILKLIFDY